MKPYIIILIFALFCSCANTRFLICGIDAKAVKGKNIFATTLGIATAIGTHILGHHIAAKLCDVKIEQNGLCEDIDYSNNPDSNDMKWVARGVSFSNLLLILLW